MTCVGIGRDAVKLRDISAVSGVHIISGIAFYVPSNYPQWMHIATVDQIADYLVREIEEGKDRVCAGLIGELASHNEPSLKPSDYRLDEPEARVFAAAAKAQRRTDVAISTHASLGRGGHAQLNALEAAGADLSRVAIGHCDAHWYADIEQDLAITCPFWNGELLSIRHDRLEALAPGEVRAERIAALAQLGYASRITLSTDTCRLSQLHRNGGRGFDYLWRCFLPLLRKHGVTEAQIDTMLINAPNIVSWKVVERHYRRSLGPVIKLARYKCKRVVRRRGSF